MSRRNLLLGALLLMVGFAGIAMIAEARRFPNVVLVTVDTLRADRLSSYGYERDTTPAVDRLLARGARFTEARTVEPLTTPALASMLTSLQPHEHASTRNGLPVRPGLPSLSKTLGERGFATAAFVGNWTLKDEISGLGEHFERYEEVLTRNRWLFFKGEATAEDLTDRSLAWVEQRISEDADRPFLLWVHYVEPHEPYRRHDLVLEQLDYQGVRVLSPLQLYDTEVAYVDRAIGELVDGIAGLTPSESTLVVFTADHGESLGEHDYWGHGRHLYENGLRIPLGITWPGVVEPQVVEGPALISDLPATILALIGHPRPEAIGGYDWSTVLTDGERPPFDRITRYQAHKGAVQPVEDPGEARRTGLLEVAVVEDGRKEIFRLGDHRYVFGLEDDPGESENLVSTESDPTSELAAWLERVENGLEAVNRLPVPEMDAETRERMESLGYID